MLIVSQYPLNHVHLIRHHRLSFGHEILYEDGADYLNSLYHLKLPIFTFKPAGNIRVCNHASQARLHLHYQLLN